MTLIAQLWDSLKDEFQERTELSAVILRVLRQGYRGGANRAASHQRIAERAATSLQIGLRSIVNPALSYDHRIVDGADAARYLSMVKKRPETGFSPAVCVSPIPRLVHLRPTSWSKPLNGNAYNTKENDD